MKWLIYIIVIVCVFGLGWFARPFIETDIEVRADTVFSTSIIVKKRYGKVLSSFPCTVLA